MNEQLQQSMSEILEYIKQGADFVREQAPLVVQEFLRYELIKEVVIVVVCCVALLIVIKLHFVGRKYLKKRDELASTARKDTYGCYAEREDRRKHERYEGAGYIGFWFPVPAGIIFSVVMVVHQLYVIEILVAPRVYVLKAMAGLF